MESGHLIICLIDYNFVVKTIRQKGVTREELNSHNRVTPMCGIYTQVIDFKEIKSGVSSSEHRL